MSAPPRLTEALLDVLVYMFSPVFSWIGSASSGTILVALIVTVSVLVITGKVFHRLDVGFVFFVVFWCYFSVIGFISRWWSVVITVVLCILAGFFIWKFLLAGAGDGD